MAPHSHRRQVLLFLAAVLLPCVALLALGLRLVVQEQELAQARLEDEQRRLTRQIRQDLSSNLERTALRQVTALSSHPELLAARAYDDSTVVLLARVINGQLILPWEQDERPRESRAFLGRGAFGERIVRGQQAEFAAGDPEGALDLYRQALDAADHPVQEAQARLFLARASAKIGREENSISGYLQLVTLPPEIVDENGIPIALYAVRQLQRTDRIYPEVLDAVHSVLSTDRWLPPPALYLLRDLVGTLLESAPDARARGDARKLEEVPGMAERVTRELARTEQGLDLKRDLANLGLRYPTATAADVETRWISYGMPAWFIGAAPVGDGVDGLVVAIGAAPALASLEAETNRSGTDVGEVSITAEPSRESEPLGSEFPGLFVRFNTPEGGLNNQVGSVQWWFYSAGFLLVIGVTLFGAYLLWRDVRREVQLAETRSRFVAAVSHELKTPLTAIRMFAETLNEGGAVDSDTRSEYLETIVNESERLTRLLNNVLDFSKIEGGKKTYRRESQSLEEIVRFTVRAMRYPLEQKRFVLRLEIDEDMPPARVDRDGIEQAIMNLLANAMKYSGESRDIDLRLRSEDGEAVIEVSDLGVGIGPAEVPRLFDRFYRVSSPENDRIPGTGLGLTLVQHIAQAHGGRVVVTSEPGKGSTFSLFIPFDGAGA
ncbi:MAG: ATP-binding protein [Gemmatimonadota bacterium]